jgi:hypothetical protein
MKLREIRTGDDNEKVYLYHCPGCEYDHAVRVKGKHPVWGWNGSVDAPTFTPSILTNAHRPELRCHCFVRNGKIQFLTDCHHKLAGKTVDIPEWED